MKEKILTLIIGILIGAIITAGGFLLFGKNTSGKIDGRDGGRPSQMQQGQMENFIPGEKPDGTPPDGANGDEQNTTPPAKPNETNNNNNSNSNNA